MTHSGLFKLHIPLVFLMCMFLNACSDNAQSSGPGPGKGRPPVLVEIGQVELIDVADEIDAIGTLEANESVLITSTVTDIVSSINFDDGQSVSKGDILVTLSSDEQSAELDEALANLKESTRQLERLKSIGGTLASKSDIDIAQAQVDVNQGRLEGIKAKLADRIVVAPFSGVLGIRKVSVGAVVSPNTEIARLDDISVLNLDFTVPEVYLGQLSVGNTVKAESPALPGKGFEGRVSFVDRRVDVATRAVQVRAELPNGEGNLFPGMLMNVTLYSRKRESLIVAESALLQVGDSSSVFVLKGDNTVERRKVKIAKRMPGKVVISEGVQPGENIVVNGTLTLQDGSKIKIVGDDAPNLPQSESTQTAGVPSDAVRS